MAFGCNHEMGLESLARGYGRGPDAHSHTGSWGVAHRIRVRLTVRYRTLYRAVEQVLFVVQSHVAIQSGTAIRLYAEGFNGE